MGERLYATGYKLGSRESSGNQCLGKGLYYFDDNESSLTANFLEGLVAGFDLGFAQNLTTKAVKTEEKFPENLTDDPNGLSLKNLDKQISCDMGHIDGLYCYPIWEDCPTITKSIMHKIFNLYMKDKEREDCFPWSDKEKEEFKKFIEEYDYFTIEHGG